MMETDVIEQSIVNAGGIGAYQFRALLVLTIPLISLTGLWQFPIFYGMNLPHTCDDNNEFLEHLTQNQTQCSMTSTYVSEFELYCDQKHVAPLLASAANIGGLIGHLIWGICQDYFGRRFSTILCSLLTFIFATCLCFVPAYTFGGFLPEYSLFLLFRFGFGLCANGMGSYTLPVELVSKDKRWMVGLFYGTGWGLGTFWHLACVYFFRDWRDAMLMQIMPLSVSLLYYWMVPESPRWLARKGRKKDAVKAIEKMAAGNGCDKLYASAPLAEVQTYEISEEMPKMDRVCSHVIKNVAVLIRFVLVSIIHLTGATLWYTIIFSAGRLPGCIFTTYFIFGVIEGPVRLVMQGFVLKLARRKGIAIGIGGAGFFILMSQILSKLETSEDGNMQLLVLITGLIAKFLSSFYWPFIETYNTELNPTIIRDSIGGLTSSIAGIGGVITPSLMLWDYHPISISIVSILVTHLLCLLPPTLNRTLPNTFEDAAAMEDRLTDFIERRRRKRSSNPTEISHLNEPDCVE